MRTRDAAERAAGERGVRARGWRVAAIAIGAVLAGGAGAGDSPAPHRTGARQAPVPTVVTGLVAEHVFREAEDGPIVDLRRVQTSEHGMRATSMGILGGEPYLGPSELLASDALEALWLIDRERRVVHRVPLVAGDPAADASPGAPSAPGAHGGVFARVPCEGAEAAEVGASTWRGRAVTLHDCLDPSGERLARQAYDAAAGIVVRSVERGGAVEEVRAIRALALGPERFVPSGTLREVGLREFLEGPSALESYAER